jgi:mannose PTS system EIIA component
MVNLIIVCHGSLADGLVNAMELIAGPQEGVTAIRLEEDDPIDQLEQRIEAAVQARPAGQGVLILADLFGASPFNASARVANRNPGVDVVTGVNLPMLLETALQRDSASLSELTALAEEAGAGSVKVLSKLIG